MALSEQPTMTHMGGQVLGNVKGVVAVVLSVLWFKNPISFIGMLGYGITVGGVVAYSQARSCSLNLKPRHGQLVNPYREALSI